MLAGKPDRLKVNSGWQRRLMVSALTLFGLDEMMARYASYEDLSGLVRQRFDKPKATLRELFGRLVFNIICGNTDDHARNHAAFWDGKALKPTPAYDICPQGRTGNEATQAMLIIGEKRMSNLAVCLEAAPTFLLGEAEAIGIICHQLETVQACWARRCDEATLSEADRKLLWRRMFFNPFILATGCPIQWIISTNTRATRRAKHGKTYIGPKRFAGRADLSGHHDLRRTGQPGRCARHS